MSIFTLFLFAVLWSAAMYYGEQTMCYFDPNEQVWKYDGTDEMSPFQSIPHTLWFVVVTMTTCGYGDNVPITPLGKFIASLTMLCGIFVIALPITILASNFAVEYGKDLTSQKLKKSYYKRKKDRRLHPPCHKAPETRLDTINIILDDFKQSVNEAQLSVNEFNVQFSKLEEEVRALRRLYRRRKEFEIQKKSRIYRVK